MNKSNQILKRLELLHPKKIDLSLSRLKKLLKKLGNPHLKIGPTIHIAGTNGKGSVTSYLRSIYEAAELKVHTYTSPHLINFNERIRIYSKLIEDQYLNCILEECEKKNKAEPITFFEITTAAAFLAFSRKKADLVLMETGLGGRFDATNVIKNPLCCVLTPISMDHMNFLGNKIEEIAFEKAGIIKKHSTVVLSKQSKVVRDIVKREVVKKKCKLFGEGDDWAIQEINEKSFVYKYLNSKHKYPLPFLKGKHQVENAATAISTVKSINQIQVNENFINNGLRHVFWPARMQNLSDGQLKKKLGKKFDIWLDGGHNEDAANMISSFIKKWKNQNKIMILAMTPGKNPVTFLKEIINQFKLLILLPIENHQYIQPYEIKENIRTKIDDKIRVECNLNIGEAIDLILKKYSSGKVLICGSLYLAGQILKEDGFKIK